MKWKRCHVESEVLAAKIKFWEGTLDKEQYHNQFLLACSHLTPEISESVAQCSPQIMEAAKLILEAPEKVDYGAFKRLMEEAKNAHLKGYRVL